MASPYVFEPLRLVDCDMLISGAVALVVCRADAAADRVAEPAYVHDVITRLAEPGTVSRTLGTRINEVTTWQLYDGFAPLLVHSAEWLGLAPPGEALDLLSDIKLGTGADSVAVNTAGGSLGEGRLHGMGHIREAVQQARGSAGDRQVGGDGDDRLVVVDIGTGQAGAAAVFGSYPAD